MLHGLNFEGGLRLAQVKGAKADPGNTKDAQHTPQDAQMRAVRSQALRGLTVALSGADKSVSLRLEPQTLGELRVELEMNEGGLSARFEATTSEARRLLDRSMSDLRQALEARGLSVEKLEVRLRPASSDAQDVRRESGGRPEADGSSRDAGAFGGGTHEGQDGRGFGASHDRGGTGWDRPAVAVARTGAVSEHAAVGAGGEVMDDHSEGTRHVLVGVGIDAIA